MTAVGDAELFGGRPLRTSTCPRCRGNGVVVEVYALRYRATGLDLQRSAGMVTATVIGAFGIFEVCREAAEVAERASRPVAFQFNDRVVAVTPGDDPDDVARQWWFDVYGETPEQTAARR